MKGLQSLLPAFGLVAAAQAWGRDWNATGNHWTTTTVTTDAIVTYCPQSTTFTHGNKTYTATASETLTITDCPCTLVTSHPAWGTSTPTTTVVPPPVWTTTTVTTDVITTYCPSPTTVVQNSKTYTVTEATTLTITDCPCTQVISSTCPPTSTPTTRVAPPPPVYNATVPVGTGSLGTGSYPAKPTTIVETVSYLTTYVSSSTAVTIGTNTYHLSSGIQTVPITSVVVTTPPPTLPGKLMSATKTPVGPTSALTTGPLQVTNAAVRFEAKAGAVAAAGLVALLF